MVLSQSHGWYFIDDCGTFKLIQPQHNSYLYFPLVNYAGMMSSITPKLNGDAKLDQNTFLLQPVSVEDLHNLRSGRNFWVNINGELWSVTGNSALQISHSLSEKGDAVTLEAGFLWHSVNRVHLATGLAASVVNFVPSNGDTVELMQVTLTNQGRETLNLLPTAAIPIYARSADNLRDHRHVTSLLHRTTCDKYGVVVNPVLCFNENGHQHNTVTYAVLGVDDEGQPPIGFYPLIEDFIGEGGCLSWPQAVVKSIGGLKVAGAVIDGYESIGGLRFSELRLQPGESKSYQLILSIMTGQEDVETLVERYGSGEKFSSHLDETRAFWQTKLSTLRFDHQEERRDGWLQWVTLQPILRRIMGNSFLPYHDYGRGGRGWRDLWQDLLALQLTEKTSIDNLLVGNFAGVRMDGSNATIVGNLPGEFKADRNSIPRVWMDHGAWPFLTTKLYLDMTGDLHILLRDQTYFRDLFSHRCQRVDNFWAPDEGTFLRTASGDLVTGTILEHLLVQHLTVFFNVGEHNLIKLEGGDWNDGLDMAAERGESVAFSAMYAGNLRGLGELCLALVEAGLEEVQLAEELLVLLDRVSGSVDYDSIEAKQARLQTYFESVQDNLSGIKIKVSLNELAADLFDKGTWLSDLIREQEWISEQSDCGWFNGYYDNLGHRVEGKHPQGVRMTLTAQVFPLMAGIATQKQAEQIVRAADKYLYDENLTGYRLNTNFGSDLPKLGRAFGFAYGHKENGAVFSHMAVMFANALYQHEMAQEAWRVLDGLFSQSQDFLKSRIYPGIPEYFNPRGRGMYPYLTGSAAWYMFTLLTETFGVKGRLGDLCLAPKLVKDQFLKSQTLKVKTIFAGKKLDVEYFNPKRLTFGEYSILKVSINDKVWTRSPGSTLIRIPRNEVLTWPDEVRIMVTLG